MEVVLGLVVIYISRVSLDVVEFALSQIFPFTIALQAAAISSYIF